MRLIRANVTAFGKLKNLTVDFSRGLNVLQQSNGFGKTTMSEFIRAMLYGFTYNRTGGATDASHFQPWDSDGRFGGSLTVEHNGKVYRIERSFGATARAEQCRITDDSTGKEQFWQMQPGEYLLGLTSDSYDRSAYFPQEAIALRSNGNLEERLANLVQNSAEDYKKIQDDLRAYKKNLRYERGVGGKIADLENAKTQAERELFEINENKRRKAQMEGRLAQIAATRGELQTKLRSNADEKAQLQQRIAQSASTDEENDARVRLQRVREDLASIPSQFEADLSQCDGLYRKISSTPEFRTEQTTIKRKWLVVVAAVVALLGVVMTILGATATLPVAAGVSVGVVAMIAAVACCFFVKTKKTRQVPMSQERDQLLAQYFAIAGKYVYAENHDLESVNRALWEMNARRRSDMQLCETLEKLVKPQTDVSQLQQELQACDDEAKRLTDQKEELLKEEISIQQQVEQLRVCSVETEDKILALRNGIDEAKYRYQVADTVVQLLDNAKENLSVSYLPRLCKRTTELLSRVSACRLEVVADRNFAISLRENGVTKPMKEFSRGIREITLLCFRVALSELLYDGAIPFLIVDDAFVNFDEQNFVRATELLSELSAHAQIIYFTCHNRTGKLLQKQ